MLDTKGRTLKLGDWVLTPDPRLEFRIGRIAYCGRDVFSYFGGKTKECVIIESATLKNTITEVDGTNLTILRTKRERNQQIMLMKLETANDYKR